MLSKTKKAQENMCLPQSLLGQINDLGTEREESELHKKGKNTKLFRKELRKRDRDMKKQRKKQFFSSGRANSAASAELTSNAYQSRLKRPAEGGFDFSKTKKLKHDNIPLLSQATFPKVVIKSSKKIGHAGIAPKVIISTDPVTPLERKLRRGPAADREEDHYIAYLESQLGYRQGKALKEVGDGLDDLFNFAAGLDFFGVRENGNGVKNVIHNEAGLKEMVGKDDVTQSESSEDGEESDGGANDSSQEYEEWRDVGGGENEEADASSHITKQGVPKISAYVPPHLRNEQAGASEMDHKLKRQLKGLLNRMSEKNIANILDSVEEVYRNHRRHDVTSRLTTLIIDGVASHSSLLDSFVILHAAFVSALHKIIGIEFAAYFVQSAVSLYEKYHSELKNTGRPFRPCGLEEVQEKLPGKECSNLMVLISELYNFQVVSAVLIYDLIRGLLGDHLTEFNVELLLKISRNSGQQLRADDPFALKDIIQIVQSKVLVNNLTITSRTKFMIETLSSLKNNKSKRNIAQNPGGNAVERMKIFLSNLGKKRHVVAHEPLRVTLEDLHSAGSRGKWWLAGAAWSGDPLGEKTSGKGPEELVGQQPITEHTLLGLARKQGMNTDIRRSVFIVLMSSEDYVDACERLGQLKLNEVQQREIVRVLLHCCGNEKTYNPYYALVCQRLCRLSHAYKITVQFCLWDLLRALGENRVGGVEVLKNLKDDSSAGFSISYISKSRWKNVAKAYGWWIAKDAISLAVLKPIDFTTLKPTTREFLREMILEVFLNSQLAVPVLKTSTIDFKSLSRSRGPMEEIFIKATKLENLAIGLANFLNEAFKKVEGEEEFTKFVKRANGLAQDTLRTGLNFMPTTAITP